MKTPTIRDVAQLANVSVATVSRVLNGMDGYSSETKDTVLSAIRELNYKRNDLARNLKTSTSHTFGLIVPILNPLFESAISSHLQHYAAEAGYSVMPFNAGAYASLLSECLDLAESNRLAGIFLLSVPPTPDTEALIKKTKSPCVSIMSRFTDVRVPYVVIDNEHAAYETTNYLIQRGHRRIALISGPLEDESAGLPRYRGYVRAMKEASLPLDESLCDFSDYSFESSRRCFRMIRSRSRDFSAVVCCSDEAAAGVLYETRISGIRVPDDLSVIGFDNTVLAALSSPPLTTYAIPYDDIAHRALELLLAQVLESKMPEGIVAKGKLIRRESDKTV